MVLGGIDGHNVLFRPGPQPLATVVDCDGFRVRGDPGDVRRPPAPDWEPPEGGDAPSRAADTYTLGLCVLRCLVPGASTALDTTTDGGPWALDPATTALLVRALEGPPDDRPSAHEWRVHLQQAAESAAARPWLEAVELDRTLVAIGQEVTVRWTARGARSLHVSGVQCPPVTVPVSGTSGACRVRPVGAGPLVVTARNDRGEDTLTTGPVFVHGGHGREDLPVPVPQLDLPLLPIDLPDLVPVPPDPAGLLAPPPPDPVPPPGAGSTPVPRTPVTPPFPRPSVPPGFATGATDFPLDLTGILTADPPWRACTDPTEEDV